MQSSKSDNIPFCWLLVGFWPYLDCHVPSPSLISAAGSGRIQCRVQKITTHGMTINTTEIWRIDPRRNLNRKMTDWMFTNHMQQNGSSQWEEPNWRREKLTTSQLTWTNGQIHVTRKNENPGSKCRFLTNSVSWVWDQAERCRRRTELWLFLHSFHGFWSEHRFKEAILDSESSKAFATEQGTSDGFPMVFKSGELNSVDTLWISFIVWKPNPATVQIPRSLAENDVCGFPPGKLHAINAWKKS